MSVEKKISYSAGGGISLGTVLFVVFLVLKLTGAINWSWWIVFLPLVLPYMFMAFFCLLFLAITYMAYKLNSSKRKLF